MFIFRSTADSAVQNTDSRLLAALVPQNFKPAYISPFSRPQFTQQLIPLIGASVKQKLQEIVEDFDDGVEFLKNAFTLKEQYAKNLVSKQIQKFNMLKAAPLFSGLQPIFGGAQHPKNYFPNMEPTVHTTIRIYTKKPYYRYSTDGSILAACESQFGNCTTIDKIPEAHAFIAEMGLDGYKKFEKQVLRGIEKQEEKKVEATLSSLASDSSGIKGKKHKFAATSSDWAPVDYKKPEPLKKAKVKSPLNTNVVSSSEDALDQPLVGNYPKKFPKVYKKSKTPPPVLDQHFNSDVEASKGPVASYNSTIYFDSTTQQETKVEAPPPQELTTVQPKKFKKIIFASASAPIPVMRKAKQKKQKTRVQEVEESRVTKAVVQRPPPTFEIPKFEHQPESSSPKVSAYREAKAKPPKRDIAAETRIRDFTTKETANKKKEATTTQKPSKPFVDRVRVSGQRGSVKFNPTSSNF